MTGTDLDTVTESLLTASRALVAVAARSLAAVDESVTLHQYRVLVVLAAHGPQLMGHLSEALGVHQSTATRRHAVVTSNPTHIRKIADATRARLTVETI